MKQGHMTGLRRALNERKANSPARLAKWLEELEGQYLSAALKITDQKAVEIYHQNADNARQANQLANLQGHVIILVYFALF